MSRSSAVEWAEQVNESARGFEDPWLMSYADLVTNLLACFVLLISMATISFESIDAFPAAFSSKAQRQPNLRSLSTDVREMVEEEGLTGRVVTELGAEGLAIQIQDQIVFESGSADLSLEGEHLVEKLAALITKLPSRYRVIVEGHTDDVPISTPRFRSNWDLSAARAIEVRGALAQSGVDGKRMSIMGFADTRPIQVKPGVELAERRRMNRRVVLRVY